MTHDDGGELGRQYWLALDGLRGSAVLGVLVCHYSAFLPRGHWWVGWLEIGWAGVDLFFVLSGFLITGILLDARGTPHGLRNFYARRFLRIFPLYYGFLGVTVLVMLVKLMISGGGGLHQLWAAQPWLWTYTANYWIPAQETWTPWAEIIIPLWSLSVEEQFYLVWPFVVLRCSPRWVFRICVAIFLGALLLRILLTSLGVHWFKLYVFTPTRADALAAGALVALLIRMPDGRRIIRRLAYYAGPIAAVAVIVLAGGFDPTRHPWQRVFLYSALAVLFAAVLCWAIDVRSLRGVAHHIYSLRPLRAVGGYGYGLYVLHLPLMYLTILAAARLELFNPNEPTWPSALAMVAANAILCGGLAVLSFHLFERPFLRLKRFFPTTPASGGGAVYAGRWPFQLNPNVQRPASNEVA